MKFPQSKFSSHEITVNAIEFLYLSICNVIQDSQFTCSVDKYYFEIKQINDVCTGRNA